MKIKMFLNMQYKLTFDIMKSTRMWRFSHSCLHTAPACWWWQQLCTRWRPSSRGDQTGDEPARLLPLELCSDLFGSSFSFHS